MNKKPLTRNRLQRLCGVMLDKGSRQNGCSDWSGELGFNSSREVSEERSSIIPRATHVT
jgi:hypothetical protein